MLLKIQTMHIRHDQYWQITYQRFWSNKIAKKKLSQFWGKFSSNALVIETCQILFSTNAVLENLPQNCDNFIE